MTRSNFGSVQYVSNGKYRIFWDEPHGPDGRRRRRSKTVYGDRNKAEAELARALIDSGRKIEAAGLTVEQAWDVVMPSRLARYTEGSLRNALMAKDMIVGSIGDKPIDDLDKAVVSRALDGVASPYTRAYYAMMLSTLVKDSQEAGLCWYADSPVPKVRQPKSKDVPLVDATEVNDWIESVSKCKHGVPLIAALGGGLRVEEAFGLHSSDVTSYYVNGRSYVLCHIERVNVTVSGRMILRDFPKNDFSRREVVIGDPFASAIIPALPSDGWLDPGSRGMPANASTAANCYRGYCRRMGMKYVRAGKLRKSWSVMHAEAMSPDLLVCQAMGHADGTMRGQAYSKTTRRAMIRLADNLTSFIEGVSDEVGTFGNANYIGISL